MRKKLSVIWNQLIETGLPRFISLVVAMVTLGTLIKMPCDLLANPSISHMIHLRLFSAEIVPFWCILYLPIKKGLRLLFSALNTTAPLVLWLERAIPFLVMQGAIYATVLHLKGDDARHITYAVSAFVIISATVEPIYKCWEACVSNKIHVVWFALATYSIDFGVLRGAYVRLFTHVSRSLAQAAD